MQFPEIPPVDLDAARAAQERQDRLTKPPGALGRLEVLAARVAAMVGETVPPVPRHPAVVVMAGDHGVAARGVSAYPSEVTPQMVLNFAAGGAAVNALAAEAGADVVVVDVGVAADFDPALPIRHAKVRAGTRDLSVEPALTRDEVEAALAVGLAVAADLAGDGCDLVVLGEMGIGNTTAAACVVAAVTGADALAVTGRGTGLDDAGLARKTALVADAVARHRPDPDDGVAVLASVGGLELAGLAGVAVGAAARRIPVVVDGFISGAAALAATRVAPGVLDYLIAGHRSVEAGHTVILAHLGLDPLLDLGLRLGEGTGGLLAVHVVRAALAAHAHMATFDEAGVSDRDDVPAPDAAPAPAAPAAPEPGPK